MPPAAICTAMQIGQLLSLSPGMSGDIGAASATHGVDAENGRPWLWPHDSDSWNSKQSSATRPARRRPYCLLWLRITFQNFLLM